MGTLPQISSNPAFVYAGIRRSSIDMVYKFGKPATLIRTAQGTPSDATKPWRTTAGTPTSYATRAVISPVKLRASRSGAAPPELYKTVVLPGDLGATKKYGTDGLVLVQTDQILLEDGITYQFISSPDAYNYDGTVIIWTGYAHPLPDDTGGI